MLFRSTKFPTINKATNRRGKTQSNALNAIPAAMRKICLEPRSSKKDSMDVYQYVSCERVNVAFCFYVNGKTKMRCAVGSIPKQSRKVRKFVAFRTCLNIYLPRGEL